MVKSPKFIFLLLILLVTLVSVASVDARTFRKSVSKNVVGDQSLANNNYVALNSADTNNAGQNINSDLNLATKTAFNSQKSSSHIVATPYGNYIPPANLKLSESLWDQLKEKDLRYVYPLLMFKSPPTQQQWEYLKSLGIVPTANSYNSYTYEIQLPLKKEVFLALDNSDFVYWAGYLPSAPFVPPFVPEEGGFAEMKLVPKELWTAHDKEILLPKYPQTLLYGSGNYTPSPGIDTTLTAQIGNKKTTYAVVMFNTDFTGDKFSVLSPYVVKSLQNVKYNSVLVNLRLDKLNDLANQPFVYWVGYVPSQLKIAPAVLNPKSDYDSLNFYFFEDDATGAFKQKLQQKGATIIGYEKNEYGEIARANIPPKAINEMADLDFVGFIDAASSDISVAGSSEYITNNFSDKNEVSETRTDISELKEIAGVTPESSFYAFDRITENLQLALTFNDVKKAKLHLQLAEERLAEAHILAQKNKTAEIPNLVSDYTSNIAESKKLGANNPEIINLVEKSTSTNIAVLQEISNKVPDERKQVVQTAIETSRVLRDDTTTLEEGGYGQTTPVPEENLTEYEKSILFPTSPPVLLYGFGNYTPLVGIDPNLTAQIGQKNTTYAIVMFYNNFTGDKFAALSPYVIQSFWNVKYNSVLVNLRLDKLNDLANQPFVYWVGYVPSQLKTTSEVRSPAQDYKWLNIHLFENDTTGKLGQQLAQRGATIFGYTTVPYSSYNDYWYSANVSAQDLEEVANLDFVSLIDVVWSDLSVAGLDESTPLISIDYLRPTYSGAGSAVCIIDSGYGSHQDLPTLTSGQDYTGEGIINDVCGHGTFVAGILLGRGVESSKYKGVAPGISDTHITKVVSTSACTGSLTPHLQGMTWCGSSPAQVVSNSIWGMNTENCSGLDVRSKKVDEMVYNTQKTYVVLAGNKGPSSPTVIAPGCSKNAITVGATLDYPPVDNIADFSSRGPTGDNRIKPDVVAPGSITKSVQTGSGYKEDSGTSYSTPHVSGLVATLLPHYPWLPGYPERVKSLIMATSIARGSYNTYGQGKIDSYTSHWIINNTNGWAWFLYYGAFSGNGLQTSEIVVPPGTQRLVVVLTWMEPPARPADTQAVVNNLDLEVVEKSTGIIRGESKTTVDNVERVVISNPPAGNYYLKTYGIIDDVFTPTQRYAMTYTIIRGNPNPTLSLNLNAPPSANVGQPFTVTADVSPASYVASGVYSKITVPADVGIQSMSTTREDGVQMTYSGDNDIVLGDIYVADIRSVSWALVSNTPGTKTVSVNAYGSNTNSPTQSVNVNIVNTNNAPTANFAFAPANPTINDIVQFTDQSTDSDGTIASWSWDFGDSTTSTLQNPTHQYTTAGTYTVSLTVTDNGGAQGSKNQLITVSNDGPPTVSVTAPASVQVNTPIRITSSATDNIAVSQIQIFVDAVEQAGTTCSGIGTASASCYKDLTYANLGSHTYYSIATDSASNTARDPASGTKPFSVVDGVAPTVSVIASPNPVQIGQTITITANANDNYQLSEIIIHVDGNPVKNCLGGVTTCTYQTSYGNSGTHTYLAFAIDSSSNSAVDPPSGTKNFTVSADTTNPAITASASPNPVQVGQTITITGNANDNLEVSDIEMFVDGASVKVCQINSQSGSCPFQTSYVVPGAHSYYSRATDSSGNQAQTAVQNFDVVADAPPTITVSAPSTVNKGQTITIASNANDNNLVSDIKVYLDGNLAKTCTINSQSGNCDYQVTFTTCGDHFYYATTSDNSGNSARDPTSGEKKFTVIGCGGSDTIPPKISLTLSGDDPSEGKRVTFTATASDNVLVSTITIYTGTNAPRKTCTINAPSGTCTYRTVWPLVRDYYAVAVDSSGNTAKSN